MMERSLAERCEDLRVNYSEVTERLARAAERSGRPPEAVELVAVTKTVPLELVNRAIELGARHIGENRVQELASKHDGLLLRGELRVSVIGHLQTNKARRAVELADMIQSVDSLRVAQAIARHAVDLGRTIPCLIEVNIGGEGSKSGVEPEAVEELVAQAGELDGLEVRGLMIIPPAGAEMSVTRRYFAKIHNMFIDIAAKNPHNRNVTMQYLSMGMSGDYAEAVEEGSNMVRVGTALFGARSY